ncbi:LAQU0S01e16160g1_1 [Lachancea quebecensis]|uniref:LAQU0S01e16160g1_1 n=1 Tax=Lachancea quebecensis TaxID=1654605 RepID=A0A0P1KM93_9SACH|nr:LAQU0S01e16160g1_1 [Lachancea quebecensis]
MAKKISKHSRAARRLEVEDVEAQTLAKLPRAQNLDLTNKLIRTASKNEQLLEAKMRKKEGTGKRVGKKPIAKGLPENLDKERLERALNITSRLDGKVQKAKSRAKYVQNARKAGWERTNESIKRDLALLTGPKTDTSSKEDKTTREDSMEQDEAYIDEDEVDSSVLPRVEASNAFDLLTDDVEA